MFLSNCFSVHYLSTVFSPTRLTGMTGVTSGAETADHSGAPEITSGFCEIRVAQLSFRDWLPIKKPAQIRFQ
jgi:hypothetical protein